jgi:hypothetical protein
MNLSVRRKQMTESMVVAFKCKAAQELMKRGLQFCSTPRQIENGTIALQGVIQGTPVSYKITLAGNVTSNKFVVCAVWDLTRSKMYKQGLEVILELVQKRFGGTVEASQSYAKISVPQKVFKKIEQAAWPFPTGISA